MLSRRDVLKYSMSVTAIAGLAGSPAAVMPPRASADGRGPDTVNVRDYGANGDGVTDDTTAIHNARNAAGVGGTVLIPAGAYLVSGLTAGIADQTWAFSDGAVIKMGEGATEIFSITGAGVSVIGGVFDGSNGKRDDWSQQGLRVKADGITVRNVTVKNSPKIGIYALNCSQITIVGCTLTDSAYSGIFVQNGTPRTDLYDIVITDNWVESKSDSANGIYVRGDSKTQALHRISISRNTVRLPYNQTAVTGGVVLFNGVDWSIDNNNIRGGHLGITCPEPTRAIIAGNVVRGFSTTGIEIPGHVDNVTISGNVVDADGTLATSGIQASAGVVRDVKISSNTIRNFEGDRYLIDFNSGSISERVMINGNLLTSSVGSGSFSGVYFNGSITGLVITGNIVDGPSGPSSWGVQFLNSAWEATVARNHFSNLGGAVVLLAAREAGHRLDYITVIDNTEVDCGATLENSTANGAVVGSNIVS